MNTDKVWVIIWTAPTGLQGSSLTPMSMEDAKAWKALADKGYPDIVHKIVHVRTSEGPA
jgi:hypothetical protein